MSVLDWLKAATRYTFDDETFVKIAYDRGISDPDTKSMDDGITKEQRELMLADIIFTAVLLSPSSTSSLSQKHGGFEQTIGSETDYYQDHKIVYAIKIYKIYGDERAEMLESARKKIKFLKIEDVL